MANAEAAYKNAIAAGKMAEEAAQAAETALDDEAPLKLNSR